MGYVAIFNEPGYLPDSPDERVYDSATEAWESLADSLEIDLQDLREWATPRHIRFVRQTIDNIRNAAKENREGLIYGPYPGKDRDGGPQDAAYEVQWVEG